MLQELYLLKEQRLILIDEEGVIAGDKTLVYDQYMAALNQLAEDRKNIVVVVSPARKEDLHAKYADEAPQVGLAAENGFFWRWNSFNKTDQDWNLLFDETVDLSWIKMVRVLMETSTSSVQGSFVEEYESCIAWNFKDSNYV